ncbi:VOC family protein [Rarobacter faecitabidus]|nr:VOC family protein [Rarobacter faecitabidus]
MGLRLGMITIDTTDANSLARWWADQFDGEIVADNDGWYVMVRIGDGSPILSFQKVTDPTPGKNRMHLDLTAPDIDAEVARLVEAGASVVGTHTMDEGFTWTVLADPDGNQFCVAPEH